MYILHIHTISYNYIMFVYNMHSKYDEIKIIKQMLYLNLIIIRQLVYSSISFNLVY